MIRDRTAERDAIEQLPDALALERRGLPFPARITAYLLIALILIGLAWASIGKVNRLVVASGKITTQQRLLTIQPLEAAIVRTVLVEPGDHVRAGQEVARLDPTFTTADKTALADKLDSLNWQIARLRTELTGVPFRPDGSTQSLIQANILAHRRAEFAATQRSLKQRTAETQAAIGTGAQNRTDLAERLAGLRRIQKMRESLNAQGYSSDVQVLQARDAALEVEDRINELGGRETEMRHHLSGADAEQAASASEWLRKANEELIDTQRQRDETAEALNKARRMEGLTRLTSPVAGTVLQIAERSIGSVLQPAEAFITIVPTNARLEAEVSIDAADIGLVRRGDRVQVKLDTYPFQRFGTLSGRLVMISPDSYRKEPADGGGTFYRATVRFDSGRFSKSDTPLPLSPGMTATAEIEVGRRTIISYLLYPIIRIFDEGLHEPR